MNTNNSPQNHGGSLGDVWFRGLAKPDHLFTPLKEDFYILVVGCMMKYIRLEKEENGMTYKSRIVKSFNHGIDGVAAICGSPFRDVYALAEKRMRPRIFIFQIHKTDRGELDPHFLHSLKRIHSWDIRSMQFISKELLVVLTGLPTFNVILFRWNTNEELLSSMATEPNLFSKLLVNPINPCSWVEYGHEHMFVYEMPSLSRTDVIRTKINLPRRHLQYEHADPLMGQIHAIKIKSASWTNTGEFFILDEHLGIHKYVPTTKVLQWTCSLKQTFLGCNVTQIVPFSDGIAAITNDGWFLNYGPIQIGGVLEVLNCFKLSSNIVRYIQFPEAPDSFYAVTESKGAIEGVSNGLLRDPFIIPDLMFGNILCCCFIEPQSDYMAVVSTFGKVAILECNTGEPIAKWKLPFKVVGIACHPILPFLFCGTAYGCVNILDIRNLKAPKLVNRRFFTREPNASIEKFGFVSQGRYVISADTKNNRVFVQYGYPFMSFDFIDTTRVPARISQISVPGCGKDDNRFQIYMSGKNESDQGIVAFVINFSLRNDRIMVIASQIVDHPVTAMCMTPMKKHLYAFYPLKKGLGVVPFCDDNQWLNLQEPEHYVECRFRHDVSFMVFVGNKLFTFGEDGFIQVHEAPVIPKKKIQLPMVLSTLAAAQTHCFSDRGIKEGIVSLDGSQVIALGYDGTFARVRFFKKPKEIDWAMLGYERSRLLDYQVGTYLIDQEFEKSGEKLLDRIADIKIHIDQLDPINFVDPMDEASDEDEDVPKPDTPKVQVLGEKLKYGPRKSWFKGATRKHKHRGIKFDGSDPQTEQNSNSKSESSSSQSKSVILLSKTVVEAANAITAATEGETITSLPRADDGHTTGDESTRVDDVSINDTHVSDDKSSGQSESKKTEGDTTVTGGVTKSKDGSPSEKSEKSEQGSTVKDPDAMSKKDNSNSTPSSEKSRVSDPTTKVINSDETSASKKSTDATKDDASSRKSGGATKDEHGTSKKSADATKDDHGSSKKSADATKDDHGASKKSADASKDDNRSSRKSTDTAKDDNMSSKEKRQSGKKPTESEASPEPTHVETVKPPEEIAQSAETPETTPQPPPPTDTNIKKTPTPSAPTDADQNTIAPPPKDVKDLTAQTAAQKLMSRLQQPAVKEEPVVKIVETTNKPALPDVKSKPVMPMKSATAAPSSSALQGLLSERTRRKQMVKDKSKMKQDDIKLEETVVEPEPLVEEVVEESAPEETAGEEEPDEVDQSGKKVKNFQDMKKAAKVLGLLFGKKKNDPNQSPSVQKVAKKKIKIKKFQGGQASKMLAAQASSVSKVKAPPSRTARNRVGQAKLVKQMLDDDEKLDPLAKLKKKKGTTKLLQHRKSIKPTIEFEEEQPKFAKNRGKGRKEGGAEHSEASKALAMEGDTVNKNLDTTVLHDPAIYLVPEQPKPIYEGLDVDDVLTVDHTIRRKEFTEAEFFAQFEKTLLYRQHIPKAHILQHEYDSFTELMGDLMMFNKQRDSGNQVDVKEFNFDDDREARLTEKAQKLKKIVHIQMVVRNKLRHATIKAMKQLLWEQFETKGMTIMGFRKRMEVSNYPLEPEKEFYEGHIKEAISWRRLELRLQYEEDACIRDANVHALRVLQHEMQFVPPVRKRLYMKSIMNIDPDIKFEEYVGSDSDQSDEEFFTKVLEELGIQVADDSATGTKRSTVFRSGMSIAVDKDGLKSLPALAASTTGKPTKKGKGKSEDVAPDYKKMLQKTDSSGEMYGDKLKKWLLDEDDEDHSRPVTHDTASSEETGMTTRVQSRRDFMMNIKPSKEYFHPKGVFGVKTPEGVLTGNEIETIMEPGAGAGRNLEDKTKQTELPVAENKPKVRMVVKQRKKMKITRVPDVIFESEDDLSEQEDEAVVLSQKIKFDDQDEEYKERFPTVNALFYGSCISELEDMYQFKPAVYRYSQFELSSRHELWNHHYIIMSEIYRMKKFFNRQFDMLRNFKEYRLKKMSERNERIREIYYYLKVDLDILDEKWKIQEDPCQIFTVTKEEMPVERYLTAEQRRLAEMRRLEDLAKRKTRLAEFRKRALIAMMDNRLEVKREEILINDIPKPAFMLEKDPLEYTLEEYLQSLQYAEAVEALEIARAELIKELEEQLGRLYRSNAMDINTIDLRVLEISLMKFQFHQNFFMEETRIFRAIRQLRLMEELTKEELRIGKVVHELKASMKGSQNMASHMENKRIQCEEEIAKVAEQEKDLERNFRRDLGDVGIYFEFFYKSYKKKPKLSLKGMSKSDVYETMVRALKADNIRAFARENGDVGRVVVMSIYDMEDPMLMPKDCPRSYWDRFTKVRRERLVCEYQSKALVAEIDRIHEAISECARKEAEGTAAISAVMGVVSHKNDLKNYFVSNVEFQMVIGKGQCEVEWLSFKEHINAKVILMEIVERLNQKIFEASDKLIKEMTKTAGVHRDIKEIEWRFLVVEMATKDLKKVRHDVTSFKPTKKLLELLRKNVNLDTMYVDRIALVDYLRTTYIKFQKAFLRTKRKLLRFYQRQTKRRHDTNDEYRGFIFEDTEALVTSQATRVSPELAAKGKEENEKRTVQLMLRGYLNRKIIRLCNEIEKLEEELEKQYQRTYPVL